MTIPVFTWDCLSGTNGTTKFRLLTAQFGDGYAQTAGDGINNVIQSWPLTFAGQPADMMNILAFLTATQGWQGFYWTPPMGVQGLYKVAEIGTMADTGSNYTLTATFVQHFQP